MEDIFQKQICSFCCNFKTDKCEKKIEFKKEEFKINVFKCSNYKKDNSKIVPIEKPLVVTAKRNYIKEFDI